MKKDDSSLHHHSDPLRLIESMRQKRQEKRTSSKQSAPPSQDELPLLKEQLALFDRTEAEPSTTPQAQPAPVALPTAIFDPDSHPLPDFPTGIVWQPDHGVIPSCLLRSALFGIVKRGQRRMFNNKRIASWPGIDITYNGQQLDQFDQDVWMHALELAKQQGGMGCRVEFTAYAFLRAIGRSPRGKSHHDRLFESLTRMVACALQVSTERFDYVGNLVDFHRDREQGRFLLMINPRLAVLFEDGMTQLEWQVRRALRRDLSRWLHGYVCSQSPGQLGCRIHLDALHQLSGSTAESREWRRTLRQSLDELLSNDIIVEWRMASDQYVFFEINPDIPGLPKLPS